MEHQNQRICAVCDKEILGQTFREGKIKIEVKESFYKGELVSVEESIIEIEKATIVNLVGNRIIDKLIEIGLVHRDGVIKINGISHVQLVRF